MDQGSTAGRRVAFFGGSFDPPHLGHLAVATAAQAALKLDTVLFAPVGAQPLKPHGSTAPYEDRLAMTELAIEKGPGFAISLADAPQPDGEPNYTLETLRKLRAELPAGSELFCLMGADSFFGLRKWRGGAEIPFAAALIVASRPGQHLDDLASQLSSGLSLETEEVAPPSEGPHPPPHEAELRVYRLRNREGETAPFYLLPGLQVEISASAIRQQVRATAANRVPALDVLPLAVADYIRSHGLYL